MVMQGETIHRGAAVVCTSCGTAPALRVERAGGIGRYAGYTYCNCGPYSRETDYYATREACEYAIEQGAWR